MRLTYVSVSTLFLAASACSTAEDGGTGSTDSTSDDSTFTSGTTTSATTPLNSSSANSSSVNPNCPNPPCVNPDTDTTRSDSSTNTGVNPTSTSGTSSRPPSTNDNPGTSQQTSAQDSAGGDSTQPDTSNDTSEETDGSDTTNPDEDVIDTGANDKFSFFLTSYHHIAALSGSAEGFGGDLRYKGAATGLEGADAICQEIARRVGFGHRTWRAYLSTSTVNAIDRIGEGPWYDYLGVSVAESLSALLAGSNRQPGGCCETGTYDEMGVFHDGKTDQNNDGIDDDDHDTMTATLQDGTYAGFSCEDWTSTTATASSDTGGEQMGGGGQMAGGNLAGGGFGGGDLSSGITMGHSWPARSGEHWATSHAGHNCAAGTNFVQDGFGDPKTVGGGGGYGGFYCFAITE